MTLQTPFAGLIELLAVVAFVLIAATAASAQESVAIQNVAGRTTTSLDGRWRTIVDPYGNGSDDGFGARYYLNAKPRDKSDLVEYDFDSSEQLNVPGDWNTQRDNLFFYEGTVWYKQSFDYHAKPDTRLFVYFGAANYTAYVYLNGEKIGTHEGGFTPFCFEITGKVRETGNFLIVAVNNQRRRESVPTLSTDWWNYGGLTRDVALVEVPRVFVQDYMIQLAKGSRDHIAGWVRLNGATAPEKVVIRIPEAGVEQTVTTDANGYAEVSFAAAGLDLWSPEHPKLYDIVVASGADTVHDEIGFRTIETRGSEILLNGKPIFLRGICIHEEAPIRPGRAFSPEDAATLLGWAKELGCNFVRLAHYPHNENMVRAADRMGLLVWSEIPVYWWISWDAPGVLENAERQLTENIGRDKNRAAIVLWSVGNETPAGDSRLRFMTALATRAKSLDQTRLVTAAIFSHKVSDTMQMLDDPLGQSLDVLGCNEYIGWYERKPEDADRVEWKSVYDKPLVVSEFGGDALYGKHGDMEARFTEEYQANLYEHQLKMLSRIPFLRGMTPWILKDFRSPRRPLPGIQDFFNRKGLVSDRGNRKAAFYVLQHFYQERAKAAE
jgi:beta-glucuronidase